MNNVVKVVEISAQSAESFEDSVKVGMDRAFKTLKGVQGAWIKDQKVLVENNSVVAYRTVMKVSFLLDE
jgi:flavin-binding protein dodecin